MSRHTLAEAVYKERLYPEVIRLHISDARLCVDCETVHNGTECPYCLSKSWLELDKVLHTTPRYQKETTVISTPEESLDSNSRRLVLPISYFETIRGGQDEIA